ncbi:MAG: bifunctional heptose 7-phosphate kinase/heptose 1-phosphate adenyltransferase [Bacillota bacterium]
MASDEALAAMAERFKGRRVLVLGDVITDVYLEGKIARISREAPVFVLEHLGETIVLGGAGNAAANLQSLGGRAVLVGIVGDDEPGRATRALAESRGIEVSALVPEPGRPSCTKTRILAAGEHTVKQQMLRVDRVRPYAPSPEILAFLGRELERLLPTVEAVVLSDYGLGILPLELFRRAMELAAPLGLPVVVDSRYRLLAFSGATLLTPNVAEAEEAVGEKLADEEAIMRAGRTLMERLRPQGLLITRGPDGMSLFEPSGRVTHIPAANRLEVFDVSGAGDTVVAAVTLGLAAGIDLLSAARLANFAAGVAVRKMGTATVSLEELKTAIARFGRA